jgi:hypothetical protein
MGSGSKPLHMLEYRQTPSRGRDLKWRQGYLVLTATRTTVNPYPANVENRVSS